MKTAHQTKHARANKPFITLLGLLKFIFWLFLLLPLRAFIVAAQPQTAPKGSHGESQTDCTPSYLLPPECHHFELGAHTPGPVEFKLLILGGKHNLKNHTAACINGLTKNNRKHRIYVEGARAGQKVPCGDFGITPQKGRECIGWDDMPTHDDMLASNPTLDIYALGKIQKEQKTRGLSDKQFDTFLQNSAVKDLEETIQLYSRDQATARQRTDLPGKKKLLMVIQSVLAERKDSKKSYQDIITDRVLTYSEDLKNPAKETGMVATFRKSCQTRNKALIATLDQRPDPDRFAIVVAGVYHVKTGTTMPGTNIKDPCAADYIENELRTREDQTPFAILTTKAK